MEQKEMSHFRSPGGECFVVKLSSGTDRGSQIELILQATLESPL